MKLIGQRSEALGVACAMVVGMTAYGTGVCGPGNGDCCIANGTPGCEDPACCDAVCQTDPFCCDFEWDCVCLFEAIQLCEVCRTAPTAWGIQANFLGPSETLVTYDPRCPFAVSTIGPLDLADMQFASGLAFTPDGRLWATVVDISNGASLLLELNPVDGSTLSSVPITGLLSSEEATDLAYNPTTESMYMATVRFGTIQMRIRELDLATANATLVSPVLSGVVLGLAITFDGHVYLENVGANTVFHLDPAYNLLGSLPLPFDADFNQGMGADWSRDDTLYLAGWDAAAPLGDQGPSYTFLPDLTGLTFHGIIGGSGSANEIADVTFLPVVECQNDGDCPDDGNPCTVETCVSGQCTTVSAVAGTPCEADDDLCTIDVCDGAGNCVTVDFVTCQDPTSPCDGGEICNSATGLCDELPDAPLSTPCEADGDFCTIDHCDGAGACVFLEDIICPKEESCVDGVCVPCPWDCADGDGEVGILDFLALLAQWSQVGTPCDFDGGGVGIIDFLKLLANWGSCSP